MKKLKYLLLALVLFAPSLVLGADAKVTELDALTPGLADLVYCVDDPAGTPVSKKCTVASVNQAGIVSTTVDPTADDDTTAGYYVGFLWVNTTDDKLFQLVDVTDGAAVWKQIFPALVTTTLDQAYDNGKVINGADSFANAFKVTDATGAGCGVYTHASLGPQVVCFPASGVENDLDYHRTLLEDQNFGVKDNEGEIIFNVAEATGAVTFPFATKQPTKSIWFGAGSLSTDGTQCAAPAEVTINSGPKVWSIICTDNDSSTIFGSVKMPDSWNGGTVTFTQVYIQTAADTGVLNGDIACQARSNGEVPSATYGTEVALDDAAVVGGNSNDMTTSAAATCSGTGVAGGDMLYFFWQMDATGTTTAVATLHHLGFMLEYTITGLSD